MEERQQAATDKVEAMLFGEEPEQESVEEQPVEALDAEVDEPEEEEEVEASEEEEPEEEEATVEIEIDGELLAVPEKYKDYFMRTADYTTKTQEVAAQRKQVEITLAQLQEQTQNFKFAESVWDDTIQVHQLNTQAEQLHQYLRENFDNLQSSEIEKIRFQIDETRREASTLANQIQQKQSEHQQAQQHSREELLKKGTEVLRQRIPGWDQEKAKQASEFALNLFSEAEVNSILDPRYVEVLWKAAQFDSLKAGTKPAIEKVQKAPSIEPKARNPMPKDTRRKLDTRNKLKRKGLSARDKERVIMEDMANRLGL
jgi:hypothetical protein